MRVEPEKLMKAFQYLYYVECNPVVSDYEYDRFCKQHGLDGGGGSDRASDYAPETVAFALSLRRTNARPVWK